jgi:hypothetical protein
LLAGSRCDGSLFVTWMVLFRWSLPDRPLSIGTSMVVEVEFLGRGAPGVGVVVEL